MKNKLTINRFMKATAILLLIISVESCKKQVFDKVDIPPAKPAKDVISTPYFDWFSADYMPTPSGAPTILVPWASGAIRGFTSDIMYDYKQEDGWNLVYNTFDPSKPLPSNPFFVLYNKYRSLLRVYVYVTTNSFVTSDYLTTGLNLGPNAINSNMLNYGGQDIVTVGTNQTSIGKIEPTQLATGVWYATQYEIAYDPNVKTHQYQDIGLNCSVTWTNVSTISLGGTQQGSINGSITSAGSSPFSLGKVLTGTLDGAGLSLFSKNGGPDVNHPENDNKLGLPSLVFKAGVAAMTGGLSDIAKGFLSGIFGGSTGATNQSVALTLNTNITLNGNATDNGALWPNPGLGLGVPGTANSQTTVGYAPHYNTPMGLFYLSSVPHATTQYNSEEVSGGGKGSTYYINQTLYSVDAPSVHIIWNPDIVNQPHGVTISDLHYDVVCIPPTPLTGGTQIGYNGSAETVGALNVWTSDAFAGVHWKATNPNVFPKCKAAIRISFHATPSDNPAAKFLYVKTFYATVDQPF
jgi:hypothetical protein